MPIVSVIIPCYNHGLYIEEAIDSVLASTFKDLEIIVINDGSTDPATNQLLKNLRKPKTKVMYQHNQGTPRARNNGVIYSSGQYFLPLDADDKIDPTLIEKCFWVLETNPKIGFVYSLSKVFGNHEYIWYSGSFDMNSLLYKNFVPVTSMIRRQAFEQVEGYKEEMKEGYEDWEFWISLTEAGWKGQRIFEPLFFYRIEKNNRTQKALSCHPLLVEKIKNLHPHLYSKKRLFKEKVSFVMEHMISMIKQYIPISVKIRLKSLLHYFFINEGL